MSTTRWLPVREAAALLGVTPDAVHKAVKRGRREAQRGNDGRLLVLVTASEPPDARPVVQQPVQDPPATLEKLLEQLARMSHLLEIEKEIGRQNHLSYQAQIARLTDALADMSATLSKQVTAASKAQADAAVAIARADSLVAELEQLKGRSIWRRVFG